MIRNFAKTFRMKKQFRLLCFFLFPFIAGAQQTTISSKKTAERETPATHKIMLIPFEPRLYMGEVDRFINEETKLSSREIRYKFRDGLNDQLYKAFKASKYNVVDFMSDTVKYRKDLEGVYQYTVYEYMKVPDQENYKVPKKEKDEKHIDKGQVTVETKGEKRFMDAKLSSQKVIPLLGGKYKTDVYLFINQLDMFASGSKDPLDLGPGTPNRKIVVHYTVYNSDSKEINSGTVEEEFDPALNNPKKIVEKHFSKIAGVLVQRVNKALALQTLPK